jgi:hypothetical protein
VVNVADRGGCTDVSSISNVVVAWKPNRQGAKMSRGSVWSTANWTKSWWIRLVDCAMESSGMRVPGGGSPKITSCSYAYFLPLLKLWYSRAEVYAHSLLRGGSSSPSSIVTHTKVEDTKDRICCFFTPWSGLCTGSIPQRRITKLIKGGELDLQRFAITAEMESQLVRSLSVRADFT